MFSLDEINQISLCPAVNSVNSSTLLRHCGHGKGGDRDTQRSGTGGVAGGSPLRCEGGGYPARGSGGVALSCCLHAKLWVTLLMWQYARCSFIWGVLEASETVG